MGNHNKTVIFVGSSTEALPVARTVESLLYRDAAIQLWTADVFSPGTYPLEALLNELERSDYAIFVLTPDDITISRKKGQPAPRDNVIFEAGLFMGRLGRRRTFLLFDPEHELKLPSDLKGLTLLPYNHKRFIENQKASLGPAANDIRNALDSRIELNEIGLISAYVKFIHPDTSLTDTYSLILAKRLDDIREDISHLERKADWHMVVEVKRRLREYFEYSGRYLEGVNFGRIFHKALNEIGDSQEAVWTMVKQVGYLLILAGRHTEGRKAINDVLAALPAKNSSELATKVLRFYCNRYLGISYQRDPLHANPKRAAAYFDAAQACIDRIEKTCSTRKELQARLWGNYGNLAFDNGRLQDALDYYAKSRDLFLELTDDEHIGIAHFQIGKTALALNFDLEDARTNLSTAASIFIQLGWIEGQGNVHEQYSLLYEHLHATSRTERAKNQYLQLAIENANRALACFERIDNQKRLGGVESVIQRLSRLSQVDKPHKKARSNKPLNRAGRKRPAG